MTNHPNRSSSANYRVPMSVAAAREWGSSRETHEAVVLGLHAIADSRRSAEAIWEDPTPAEWDHICMAVEEYVRRGIVPAEPDGRYSWGQEIVKVANEE